MSTVHLELLLTVTLALKFRSNCFEVYYKLEKKKILTATDANGLANSSWYFCRAEGRRHHRHPPGQ